jgi:ribosomal protein S18 acetylase RimI-like enzyme
MPEYNYVEMICLLEEGPQMKIPLPEGYDLCPLSEADEDDLYNCYHAAFHAGDASFFFDQSEIERRKYFDTLGLANASVEPGSSLICINAEVVGFTYLIPYGEGNRHISCMVVHPDYQRQGLGAFMVAYAIGGAAAQGHRSITLGTEKSMAAFQLYRKYGFQIMEGNQT